LGPFPKIGLVGSISPGRFQIRAIGLRPLGESQKTLPPSYFGSLLRAFRHFLD